MTRADSPKTVATKLVTAEDLLALGDNFHGELVRGELIGTMITSTEPYDPTGLMTAEEFFQLGDDFHGELVRGKLITMSPAGFDHGDIAMAIGSRIRVFADDNGLGCACAAETGFLLSREPDTVRAPDVGFVVAARIPLDGNIPGFFEGAPDLAVEVLSPSNTQAEMTEKAAQYLKAGTRLVWIVNPFRKTVTVYNASHQDPQLLNVFDSLNGGEVLPGFTLALDKIFK